jgi:hypothetical protein
MTTRGGGVTSHAAEIDTLREQVRQLKRALHGELRWPVSWGLTPCETVVLGVLVTRQMATHDVLVLALDHGRNGGGRAFKQHVHFLRNKVRARGVVIHNARGHGWWLSAADRARLRQIATEQSEQ